MSFSPKTIKIVLGGCILAISFAYLFTHQRISATARNQAATVPPSDTGLPKESNGKNSILVRSIEKPSNDTTAPLSVVVDRETTVLELFVRTKDVDEKIEIASKLRELGGDKSALEFINILKLDRGQQVITRPEQRLIDNVMFGLSRLASRSKAAEEFLIDGLKPSFWEQCRSWRRDSEADEKWENQSLAGRCLLALSMNSSPRVSEAIADWQNLPDDQAVDWSSFIVDAAFNLSMIKQMDESKWANVDPQERHALYENWIKDGIGKDFYKRFCKLNKIP